MNYLHGRRLAIWVVAIATYACSIANAHAEDPTTTAPYADAVFASDTDGFRSLRLRGGALFNYANRWSYAGIALQNTRYEQGAFHKDVTGVVGLYKNQRRANLAGFDVEAGMVETGGHVRAIGDATWRAVPMEGTAIDILASADLVDTPKALNEAIGYALVGTNLEHQFGTRFTVTALGAFQSFTDGNSRLHARGRLIWLVVPDHGITAQLQYRHYHSNEEVAGTYFNPRDYQQWLGVAAIRKRVSNWLVSGRLGTGQERTTGVSSHPSHVAEVRAEGEVFGGAHLVLRAGYFRSAGFIDSPDYAYRLVGATLVLPL